MPVYVPTLTVAQFEEHFFEPSTGTYDPEGRHHEFNQGLHGRKIDFDAVLEDTPLYDEWVDVTAGDLVGRYTKEMLGRAVLIGVANGTNRLARDVSVALDCGAVALETVKIGQGNIQLTPKAIEMMAVIDPELAIITEDIATKGTNGVSVALSTHRHRSPSLRHIVVSHTIQRGIPERLVELGIPYHSLITRMLRNYKPDVCRREGYCAKRWKLVPYPRAA